MNELVRGSYGVLARWPSGGVAAAERSFAMARSLAERSLLRFRGGEPLASYLPREPAELLRDHDDAFVARVRTPPVEVALVRFREDPELSVPLPHGQALVARRGNRFAAPMLFPDRRSAWEAAATIHARLPELTLDTYPVDDRRPIGGVLFPDSPRLVTMEQAMHRALDALDSPASFEGAIAAVAGG